MKHAHRSAITVLFGAAIAFPLSVQAADLPLTVAPTAEEPAVVVDMLATQFAPETIVVRAGQTVTWRNTSGAAHTVTADPAQASDPANVQLPPGAPPFGSGTIQPGEQYQYTFTTPGEYRYVCLPHEGIGMVGYVTVQP
jgi:plastocyanin